MGTALYNIFIFPLEYLFSYILTITSCYVPLSISVVVLSACVQILSEPLYRIAYKIEDKEKKLQKKISTELNVLKTLYAGEILFYRTEALYKKLNYNPLLAFRSSMSLFLIIPFFVAAYQVLNNNPLFMSATFFGLFNLSSPDHLLLGINLFPFLMAGLNLIAVKFSNIDKPLFDSSNIMLLCLCLFFLIYLYNSSSALLLYWTINNVISILKLVMEWFPKSWRKDNRRQPVVPLAL
ncbi:MAG: YidC/Oxa1 family membrane protein insertase [Brevinema sp.]